ncbi:MAG: PAS domain S-box protein [Aliarcobacter sp.]|nr:PAS domain S-box protein [Aliarcobacter sp.]
MVSFKKNNNYYNETEKNNNYEKILDNSPYITYLIDVTYDGRFIHRTLSNAYIEITGLAKEELLNNFVDELENKNFKNLLIEKYLYCLKEAKKVDYIKEYDFPSGKKMLHSILTPIFDDNGHIYQIVGSDRDITDEMNIQKQLEDAETKLKAIISTIPDMIWLKDVQGVYLACNSVFEEIFSVKEIEIIGKTDYDFFKKEDADICKKTDMEALDSNSISISEETIIYPDETIGIIEIRKVPVYKPNSELLGVLGIARDITKNKLQDEMLKKSEREYRTLAQHAEIPIYRYDENLQRIYVNPAVEKLSGKTVEELINKGLLETSLVNDEYKPKIIKSIKKVFEEGKSNSLEVIFTLPNGTQKHFLQHHIPEFSTDGKVETVLSIGHDISAQKELSFKEEMFRTLVENSPNIIMRYNTEATRIYANPAFSKQTAIPLTSLINIKPEAQWNMFLNMINMTAFEYQKRILQVVLTGKNDSFILEWKRFKDGKITTCELNIVAERNTSGEIIGALAIGHDMTKQKLITEKLATKEQEFRSLTENLPDNVARWDKDGHYLYLNSTLEQTLGMKASFLIGKKIQDIMPHHTEVIKAISDVQNCENDTLNIHQLVTTKNGNAQTHHIKFIAERNHKNEIVSILAVGRDITEIINIQKELKESVEFSQGVINAIPDLLFEVDKYGKYLNFWSNNDKFIFGQKENLLGKTISDVLSSQASQVAYSAIKEAKEKGSSFGKVYSIEHPDGEKWFELSLSFKKTTKTFLALVRDITQRKKMEKEVLKQKNFQESLLKGIAKAGMSVNVIEEGKYIYTNNLELAFEYGYEDIVSKKSNFLETIHPDDKEKVALMYQKRLEGEELPNTYNVAQVNKKGERREHEISVVLIPNTNPIQTLVVTKDVTEQKNIEKRIEFMAHHDILTGLPNRLLLKDRAKQIIANAKRFEKKVALLFIDLDGFKTINDSLGHSIGDIVLKMVSQRLQSCVRACDTLSRQGGDEFILILSDINEFSEVSAIATKLLKQFQKIFDVKNQHLSTTASIGIAMYPEHGSNFEQLLQNADAAMYKAKENGKNTYCFFTQQMRHNQIGIFRIQNDLKEAIKNKEFILHYQPQIDLISNKIIGAEALIRWEHPILGMIPPMNFISIAESSGLIVQIGEWVIQEACKQAAIWNNQGKEIVVAVNVSAIQFKRGNLIDVVKKALDVSGLNPKYLELELTESILISDTENILRTVKVIKELGIQLSIDDFGTGYSSLSYLKRFAVDKLKIDQSFVRDIVQDKDDATIVKTIIQMAKSFNLKSIAEGVENEAVLKVLHEYGCDEVQGYHFSKPMIVEDFENYYNNNLSDI